MREGWLEAQLRTDYHACKGCDDVMWHRAGRLDGMACVSCRSVYLNLSHVSSLIQLRLVLYHELLHLRHPSWDEEKTQAETECFARHPRRQWPNHQMSA